MHKPLMTLVLACLLGAMLGFMPITDAKAGAPLGASTALQHQTLVQPVRVWRDCQRIARCHGCAAVYRCRSCSYQRQCKRGLCEWGDICVWGPYIPLAPRGVRVY
jgi:hypothetical protein